MSTEAFPIKEVCARLRLDRETVTRLIRDGHLGRISPALLPGKVLVPEHELERFLADNTVRNPREDTPHDPEASAPARRRRGARPRARGVGGDVTPDATDELAG